MTTDSPATTLSFNRIFNLASIGLLALMIFGLARLGFGVVPVWILAVPFVLLASLDIESCFARARTFSARLMPVAFHFVIIATVFAAHQQIGGMQDSGYKMQDAKVMAGKSSAWGCAAGGCGSSGGGCGGSCGGSGASAAGGAKSACGCSSGKATASTSRPAGQTNPTATKRTQPNRVTIPLPATRPAASVIPGVANTPLPGNAVGPKLGAGLVPTAGLANVPPAVGPTLTPGPPLTTTPKSPIAVPAINPGVLRPASEPPLIAAPEAQQAPASTPVQPGALPAAGDAAKISAPSPPPATGAP